MSGRAALDGYEATLREHLRGAGGERTLLEAYEVGRELMSQGRGVLDAVRLHSDALASIVATDGADTESQRRADNFLSEVMAPFEMAYRGFEEANHRLRDLTASLEEQVQQRTSELQESLSTLQAVDADRRRLLERVVSAQEQERHRIAADLHDDTIQVLTALAMRLSALSPRVGAEDQARLGRLEQTVGEAIGRLRRMTFELRPPALDQEGLAAAIRTHVDVAFESVECTVEDRLETEPSVQTREHAYRITQEALANVRKHAYAGRVHILLTTERDGLRIAITDDGVGLDPTHLKRAQPGHLGITAMRERAALAGGSCTIESQRGEGTTVEVRLRLEPPCP